MFSRVQLLSRQSTSKWLQATRAPKRSETSGPPGAAPRMDRTVIEGLHDIVSVLEDHLKPLVQAEVSVLVDVLYRPELLFPTGPDARRKCEQGGFIRRLITHTTALLEDRQDKLCVLILQTLREMMSADTEYGDKGDSLRCSLLHRYNTCSANALILLCITFTHLCVLRADTSVGSRCPRCSAVRPRLCCPSATAPAASSSPGPR